MIAARAPNHLGDGVMALPAMHALAALGPLTIHAPRWGADLYADVDATVVPRGPMRADVAVLFPPSLRAAWEARRCGRVIGTATDARRWLLTDVVGEGRHRRDTYAALAATAGARVLAEPEYRTRGTARAVPDGHVGLNPLSNGGFTREWARFRALADALSAAGHPVVFYAGPGEAERLASRAGPYPTVVGCSLPDFAATLERCAVFVSNDTGPAHFARACGIRTVVVFGSTHADHTGPAGAVAVENPVPCRPCYRRDCVLGVPCLDVPVARVAHEVERCLSS